MMHHSEGDEHGDDERFDEPSSDHCRDEPQGYRRGWFASDAPPPPPSLRAALLAAVLGRSTMGNDNSGDHQDNRADDVNDEAGE